MDAALGIVQALLGAILLVALGTLYFWPAIVARKKRNLWAIFVLNLLLGWTLVGWVIALVWACMVETPAPKPSQADPPTTPPRLCVHCGKYSPGESQFCPHCGKQLEISPST